MKNNNDSCFSLRQRAHILLFEAFKIVFGTQRKVENRIGYSIFVVSSVKDIKTVFHFFSYSNLHPLVGYKLHQYNIWIEKIRLSKAVL